MKKTQLLTILSDIGIATTKTCILFMISTATNQFLRESSKIGNEQFSKGYRYVKNRYL